MAKLAIVIPTYHTVSTAFFTNFLGLDRKGVTITSTIVSQGVYVAAAMRGFREDLLREDKHFDRMLVIEADMILPRDALQKHASYTEPIVGGAYFMHHYPYAPIFTAPDDTNKYHRTWDINELAHMLDNPALYESGNIGFGCTSIRRDVLEDWPADEPSFANLLGRTADGRACELGHDVAFHLRARALGWKSFVDTSLLCGQLTETTVTVAEHDRAFANVVKEMQEGKPQPSATPTNNGEWVNKLASGMGIPSIGRPKVDGEFVG